MDVKCEDLPEECWELIIDRLGHHSHFEALSLVSKRFLSISNRLRSTLSIVTPTITIHGTVSMLFQRFPNLKSVDLSEFRGDLDFVVRQIAQSDLNLEALNFSKQTCLPLEGLEILGSSMRNLKVLDCTDLLYLRDVTLFTIANSMLCLEELDISNPHNYVELGSISMPYMLSDMGVTDGGIKKLASNLINLRKIDVSGNYLISDKSLVALSSNCVHLREIVAENCAFITPKGIHFVINHSVNLSSFSVNSIRFRTRSSPFEDSLPFSRALHTLNLSDSIMSDEFLRSIVKACLPLRHLNLSGCRNFTSSGLSLIYQAYQSLEYLALDRINFLTDQLMSDLSQFLYNLTTVKLNYCSKLTTLTFFSLAKNCPSLKCIEMGNTSLGEVDCILDFVMNPQIKSLDLSTNPFLDDEGVIKIASVCPKLELLDVHSCSNVTEGGLVEVLKICCEIRDLQIEDCVGIKSIGTGSELWKLETIEAARSGINDEGLAMIGKMCPGLVNLDVEGCLGITSKSVMEMVGSCKRLREINLKMCQNVDVGVVDWMVFSSPSLRKIISPNFSFHTGPQKMLFLRHGCLVCER